MFKVDLREYLDDHLNELVENYLKASVHKTNSIRSHIDYCFKRGIPPVMKLESDNIRNMISFLQNEYDFDLVYNIISTAIDRKLNSNECDLIKKEFILKLTDRYIGLIFDHFGL